MQTEQQIKNEIEKQKSYLENADTRYDWTQKEVIQEIIKTLEWVLKGGAEID